VISLINFYVLVLFFTALIVIWTTYMDHDCVVVGGLLPIGTLPKRSVRRSCIVAINMISFLIVLV